MASPADEIAALRAAVAAAEQRAARAEADAAGARAEASGVEALITHQKLQIEKLRRELYGVWSERKARIADTTGSHLPDLLPWNWPNERDESKMRGAA